MSLIRIQTNEKTNTKTDEINAKKKKSAFLMNRRTKKNRKKENKLHIK